MKFEKKLSSGPSWSPCEGAAAGFDEEIRFESEPYSAPARISALNSLNTRSVISR